MPTLPTPDEAAAAFVNSVLADRWNEGEPPAAMMRMSATILLAGLTTLLRERDRAAAEAMRERCVDAIDAEAVRSEEALANPGNSEGARGMVANVIRGLRFAAGLARALPID